MKTKLSSIHVSSNDKLTLISNLGTMLSAGIPILESVESLLEDSKGNLKKVLEALKSDLIQGKHMYVSLSKFPNVFNSVTTNIIKASEEAGTLDVTLKDVKDELKKEIEFTDKVKSALTYPFIVLIVFIGVLLMMLIVVIPKISSVFVRLKVDLPLPTKILIILSDTLVKYTLPVTVIFVLLCLSIFYLYRSKRQVILNALFSLPLVSRLAKEVDLTRFSRSLHLLLTSGIPITSALDLSKDVVLKAEIHNALIRAKDAISSGKKFSDGLKEKKKVFPSIMIKIIEAGEISGSLDKSMLEVSEFLDYSVTKTLKTVTALIEPVMLVLVGVMVGGMMLAIIAPIYGLISQIGPR